VALGTYEVSGSALLLALRLRNGSKGAFKFPSCFRYLSLGAINWVAF